MAGQLDRLVVLYKALEDSPAENRDVAFLPLKRECIRIGSELNVDWASVYAHVKREYFQRLRADDRRLGR